MKRTRQEKKRISTSPFSEGPLILGSSVKILFGIVVVKMNTTLPDFCESDRL
jgi:hypothetical protein